MVGGREMWLCSWRAKHELEVEGRRQHSGGNANPAFRLRPKSYSYQIGFQSSAFFPGRPRTCWSVIGGRNENRADGPTGLFAVLPRCCRPKEDGVVCRLKMRCRVLAVS